MYAQKAYHLGVSKRMDRRRGNAFGSRKKRIVRRNRRSCIRHGTFLVHFILQEFDLENSIIILKKFNITEKLMNKEKFSTIFAAVLVFVTVCFVRMP